MNLATTLLCIATTILSSQAITVSVDRADVRPVTVPSDSIYVNGWRPLTSINNNYDQQSHYVNVDRSLVAPLHPVLGKLQEHMQSASDRLKPQRRNKPSYQALIEYSPASLPAGFALYSTKQRLEGVDPKSLSTEREYAFLIPPPRDGVRFEIDALKKIPLRDSEPYVRSSQFVPQAIKPDPRSPQTYFIKPSGSYSAGVHPFSQTRPFVDQYNVQQASFVPNKSPVKPFDGSKSTNDNKPFYQSTSIDTANTFNKESNVIHGQDYEHYRLQPQQQKAQTPSQQQKVVNGNNYYNQINHPTTQNYKQSAYERDPSFLVHESHEVSYVTPSYKYRPITYHHLENNQESYPSSTTPSRVEYTKFTQQPTSASVPISRPDTFKYQTTTTKDIERQRPEVPNRNNAISSNNFYVQDFQKTRYTPDINEVLPKVHQPVKFNQISTTQQTTPYVIDHSPKVVYVRPELQQHQQYQSSIIPININQRPTEVEYETPESVSLKHFNEQQFLLQQQLIQQDRQRLSEQEKRRQQELMRQQKEELYKRQQEIKLLETKHKEKQRLEQLQTVEPDVVKELPIKPQFHQFIAIDEPQKKLPKEQQQYKYVHQTSSETPYYPQKEDDYKQVTVQKYEEIVTPSTQVNNQATTQEDFQPIVRPYRPQKPLNREQLRKRKPTTLIYDPIPTEVSTISAVNPETSEVLTDVPVQTIAAPETTTQAIEKIVIRTRRPGQLRRRRPFSTTSTTESSVSLQEYDEDSSKYNSPENQEFEKKKRIRPNQDGSYERRPLRKRPGHRVKIYKKEHYDSLPERIRSDESLKDISPTENYPAPFLKELYSSEYLSSSEKKLPIDNTQQEVSTTEKNVHEFYPETTVTSNLENYEPTLVNREEQHTQNIDEENTPLDHEFIKTEVNLIESTPAQTSPTFALPTTTTSTTTTTMSTTTIPTTTTITEAPTTLKTVLSSPKGTHRMRPGRYGNATRPRFSIKDYKSRMDYKNRLASSSTTEASTATSGPKQQQRGHKNHQPADPNFKEAANRYNKHATRSQYRTTTTSTNNEQVETDIGTTNDVNRPTTVTTTPSAPSNRFTPKKRIVNSNHQYRTRLAIGSTTPASNKQDDNNHHRHSLSQSTARPENSYPTSSLPSIRKRPTLKNKMQPFHKLNAQTSVSEMQSAAESGNSFTTTSQVTTFGISSLSSAAAASEAINEVFNNEPSTTERYTFLSSLEDKKTINHDVLDPSDVTIDEGNENHGQTIIGTEDHLLDSFEKKLPHNDDGNSVIMTITESSSSTTTTPFDVGQDEELFAKASQSVADLTSSASALYDKPGLFKAVSSTGENNRAISARLKIVTDEPTLPIEAFFQEIQGKKN